MNSFPAFDFPLFAFWSPGPGEMMLLAVVALLLYGGNLPEVARSWGKTFAEFRRSLTGLQSEFNDVVYSEPEKLEYHDDSHYVNGYEEDSYDPSDEPDDEPTDEPTDEPSTENSTDKEIVEECVKKETVEEPTD